MLAQNDFYLKNLHNITVTPTTLGIKSNVSQNFPKCVTYSHQPRTCECRDPDDRFAELVVVQQSPRT